MNLIVAVDNKWGIGKNGHLLAHIPSDMKYFKEKTSGHVVVMGRKTLESMPGRKGLPNRTNYVLTTNAEYDADGTVVVNSEEALAEKLKQYSADEVFLIGGASLYNKFYKKCDKLFITKMDADLDADTFIVNIDEDPDFKLVSVSEPICENGITYRFTVYERR